MFCDHQQGTQRSVRLKPSREYHICTNVLFLLAFQSHLYFLYKTHFHKIPPTMWQSNTIDRKKMVQFLSAQTANPQAITYKAEGTVPAMSAGGRRRVFEHASTVLLSPVLPLMSQDAKAPREGGRKQIHHQESCRAKSDVNTNMRAPGGIG